MYEWQEQMMNFAYELREFIEYGGLYLTLEQERTF